MKRVAIFENEFDTVEVAFQYAIHKYYNNQIDYKVFTKSQELSNIEQLKSFSLIIIDIDLSSKSKLDGFGLIRKIEGSTGVFPEIIIMTGQNLSKDYHLQNNLKKKYEVLEKTINFLKIKELFDRHL